MQKISGFYRQVIHSILRASILIFVISIFSFFPPDVYASNGSVSETVWSGAAGDFNFNSITVYLEMQPCALTVTNLNDSGPGSLREAINCANASPGPDTISFNVSGIINITSPLPALSDNTGGTLIDGSSAPGYSGTPTVILDGPGAFAFNPNPGIKITSAANEVRALQIVQFRRGIDINGGAASGNIIAGNYLGTDGTVANSNIVGVSISDAPNNRIGTDSDGVDDSKERNVISGNITAVSISLSGSTGNVVAGNFI